MVALSPPAVILIILALLVFFYLVGKQLYELRESQKDLRRALKYFSDNQNYPIPSWVIDMNGLIVFANKAAIENVFSSLGESQPIGKSVQGIFPTELADLLKMLEIKAFNSSPRTRMAKIKFPAGNMYVIQ